MVYAMWNGPQYRTATAAEDFDAAMAEPMSLSSTLWDQAKGGALESFGLGTAIRDLAIPEGNVPQETRDRENALLPMLLPLNQAYQLAKRAMQSGNREQPSMSEDEYKASAYFRSAVPWDRRMTEDRAAALADWYDARQTREHFASKRPITSFIGNLAGQAVDPINYIPIAGPAVRGASIARVAGTAAFDAAANTAIFGALTQDKRESFGDDVSWQATVSEVAMAALIGGAFGTAAGALGKRRDVRIERQATERLSTIRNTQEARIALNEAIGSVVRGEDIRLSPNATDPVARVSQEVERLGLAYDTVQSNPTGRVDDPLVRISPEQIEGTLVARGAFEGVNEVEFSERGYGLVKVIWGHGENSSSVPEYQVRREDITELPNVIREYAPAKVSADGARREWRVERDGRTVVYADKIMKGDRHLVTAYVQEPTRKGFDAPLSQRVSASQPVPSDVSTTQMDTAGGLSASLPGAAERPSGNIAPRAQIDNSPAAAEPIPDGRTEAESRVARTDDYKALASQYRVDPQTGAFIEDAEIDQLRTEGRLTEDDTTALKSAQDAFDNGAAWGDALRAAVGCLI